MSVFGIHEKALFLKTQRMGVLAKNIANADTPNFKAKDVDFRKVLNDANSASLRSTHNQHFEKEEQVNTNGEYYSIPFNPSMDGNTVELAVEQMEFAENAIRYQTTLDFINSKVKGLIGAIRGE